MLAGIWTVRAPQRSDLEARVLPNGATCLVFLRDGSQLRTTDDDGTPWSAASISGPRTGPLDIRLAAGGEITIVQLLPEGATQALGTPMSGLTDSYQRLDAVIGTLPAEVADATIGDASEASRVGTLERWLKQRVLARRSRCDVTDVVAHEVARRAGRVRVDDLAGQVNLSRRHLGRIIQQRLGFPPKLFARITRFHQAVQLGRIRPLTGPIDPWIHVALASGYADQAHMSREFAELGGIRPSDLRGTAASAIW